MLGFASGSASACMNAHSPTLINNAVSFGGDIIQGNFVTGNSKQNCTADSSGGKLS